jgi:lysophospholipase L1-like esterase
MFLYNASMQTAVSPWRLLLKGILLCLILEALLIWALPGPEPFNVYAALNMKRQRLPLSTSSPFDDAQDLGELDAMLAAHVVSNPKAPDEFRVLVLGDSATWGLQLSPEETMPAQLDALQLKCGSKNVRVYNLSFPRSSATKDLMILDKALQYKPDLIVWSITWYTLMPKTRVDHWLIAQNPEEFYQLGRRFGFLPRGYTPPTWLDSMAAHNAALFHELRFQSYAAIEMATGMEQIPGPPEHLPGVLSRDLTFEGLRPPELNQGQVSLDQVADFYSLAGSVPVVLVNEPILIMSGVPNSDVRYNSYYPRWVYDQYRQYVSAAAMQHGWNYLDLWDMFPASQFTDTPLHLNPAGQHLLAERLAPTIERGCP